MSKVREAGYIMRIGVAAFVLPVWALVTAFFAWNGDLLYMGLMLAFGTLMGYGVYRNFDRLKRSDTVDDERMKEVNRKGGSSAFWTVLDLGILVWLSRWFLAEKVPGFYRYDVLALIGLGFFSYLGFRLYYLKYGVEANFWKPR